MDLLPAMSFSAPYNKTEDDITRSVGQSAQFFDREMVFDKA